MTAAARSWSPIRRWLRHLLGARARAARAFAPATLDALTEAIAAGERTHRGQVRLILEKALPWPELRAGIRGRRRALALFADHGVWDTEENCGVLVYVNLADHTVDIVADRGIARKVDAATWQAICDGMTAGFARGEHRGATLTALDQVNELLRRHFPVDAAGGGAHSNELPDAPLML
ncbi:TPM domain-containing protein [Massilia sp. 9096]|uniref:TPM domain-containing protein n=1 Tax=Massilia sp. 9096 TaxID=1500894 RepID=UPI0005677356|nr:TPM domain-containing protein [Massilia sp. 9096]